VSAGQQKIQILCSVGSIDSNFFTIKVGTSSGNWTVNWGDGTPPETTGSGLTLPHKFVYAGASPVLTAEGYRQALVEVTPVSGSLTMLDLNEPHAQAFLPPTSVTPVLDVVIGPATVNTLILGGTSGLVASLAQRVGLLSVPTSMTSLGFQNCRALMAIECPGTLTYTNTSAVGLFSGCTALETIPDMDFPITTDFTNFMASCAAVSRIPALGTGAGTIFVNMFAFCYSLRSIASINTSNGLTFTSMFQDCISIFRLPTIDVTKANTLTSIISGCYGLRRCGISGAKNNWTLVGVEDPVEVESVYSNLGTVTAGSRTLTVSNVWGAQTANKAIATGKGWVVTGP